MLRALIAISVIGYISSLIGLFLVESLSTVLYLQLYLTLVYMPFFIVFGWALYLASFLFIAPIPNIKINLIAFGINSIVFIGWLGVIMVHFSIFMPHA